MITVIVQGTKNLDNTLKSLNSNAVGKFRVMVDEGVTMETGFAAYPKIEPVRPKLLRKYGKMSDVYWRLPSGCLVLTASWDLRIERCVRQNAGIYCLIPSGSHKHMITNSQYNVGKWKGARYFVPILTVLEG